MILAHGRVITNDPDMPFLANGALRIQGNEIIEIGDADTLISAHPDEEVFNAHGKLIMPGMINAHTHIYSAYARGMGVSRPTRDFFEVLQNIWWQLDKQLTVEDSKLSAYATISESIKNGVTTIFDHHASPNGLEGSLFAIAEAAQEMGIRGDFCYETTDRSCTLSVNSRCFDAIKGPQHLAQP